MTADGVPYIGRYTESRPNWYVATGFQKWGMTSAVVSAMLLLDLICGVKNPYADVFDPGRFIPSLFAARTSAVSWNGTRMSAAGTAPAMAPALTASAS